jgi:transcription elongation factor Elf1
MFRPAKIRTMDPQGSPQQEDVMSLQSATPVVLAFTRYFSRPQCPRCGDEQLVPEHSEFVREGRIRHIWSCEACGHEFCTTVEIGRIAA